MSQEYYSPEDVAARLRLHVKTVRQFLRDGRLRGTRVGKQYRIAHADLRRFLEAQSGQPPVAGRVHAEAASVVTVEAIDAATADRLSTTLLAALAHHGGDGVPLRLDTIFDPERGRLRLIVSGGVESTAELLRMISALVKE